MRTQFLLHILIIFIPDPLPVPGQGPHHRPVLLFLHGFLGDRTDFQTVIDTLSDSFFCLSLDLPGHGQSICNGHDIASYTMPTIAAAIVQWAASLNIPQIYLIGYSMGGRLALYLALNYPQVFPKVVIESASPGLITEMERHHRRQQDEQLAQQIESDLPKFLANWYNQPLFQSLRQDPHFAAILQRRSRHHPAALAQALRGMSTGRQPSLWDDLTSHRQPLLLIVGERDRKFLTINQQMAALCPTAHLAVIPHAGHNVHLENPQAFSDRLRDFFTST